MATDATWAEHVLEQAEPAGNVRIHKMFGEYALYVDDKVVALLCDNLCFLKPTEAGRALLETVTEGQPYPGAKPHWDISDLVDLRGRFAAVLRATADALPPPKPKRTKAASTRGRGTKRVRPGFEKGSR